MFPDLTRYSRTPRRWQVGVAAGLPALLCDKKPTSRDGKNLSMARRIPPLNPLHSFEAAARHGSFARAAAELSVTPAAISRQVKMLERYFGVDFFEREPGGVTLTPEARVYATGLSKAFRQIAALTDDFRTQHTSSILTVQGYTTFLVKWLVPRLPDFQARHPHIKVRLATAAVGDPVRAEADVVIRYGGPNWPGFVSLPLFQDELVAVCSRAMLGGPRAKSLSPAQIARLPLLVLEARRADWSDWFALGEVAAPKNELQTFEDLAVVLEFARRGLGVALAQRAYVEEDLTRGNLMLASELVLRRELGYCALARTDGGNKTKVAAFFDWLKHHQTPVQANQK
jgi:DNA-binding transcriptional LysR family regulator